MTYTTLDKVLHRAKLRSTDVHANSETATAIVSECMADAEAEINLITRKPDGWTDSEKHYTSIQAAATNLAASYLFEQDLAALASGRVSREVTVQRSTELYNRAMAMLNRLSKKLYIAVSEGDLFYRTDQHKWHIYNGSAWKELTVEQLRLEAKSVQSDYNGGWSASWTTAFSSTPTVVCSREDSGQGYPVCSSKSTTACSGVIKDYAGGGEHYANVGVHAREPT